MTVSVEFKDIICKCLTPVLGDVQALRVLLCSDEIVIVTIDARTGRLTLRDTGDLASASRAPRFSVISEKLNENPTVLFEALYRLRVNVGILSSSLCLSLTSFLQTIIDLAEQKAHYLGLQSYRRRNIRIEGLITFVFPFSRSHTKYHSCRYEEVGS